MDNVAKKTFSKVNFDHSNLDMRGAHLLATAIRKLFMFSLIFSAVSIHTLINALLMLHACSTQIEYVGMPLLLTSKSIFFRQFVCTQCASILLWDLKAANAGAPHLGSRRDHRGASGGIMRNPVGEVELWPDA